MLDDPPAPSTTTALPTITPSPKRLRFALLSVTSVLLLSFATAYYFGFRPSWPPTGPSPEASVATTAPMLAEEDATKLLLERASLVANRVLVVDMGRILAAWAAQPSALTDPSQQSKEAGAMMARIKAIMRIYSDAGYSAFESRYLLTYPAESDQTAVVARVLNILLTELHAQNPTPYLDRKVDIEMPLPARASPKQTSGVVTSTVIPALRENPKDD